MRVFTGYQHPSASADAQEKLIVDSLRECAQRVAELGVTVGVQNHHDIACGFLSQFDLIQEINEPNCRAMFDAWAPALHDADLNAAATKMAKITVYTTTANYEKRPRYRYNPQLVNYETLPPSMKAVPIDEGFIDYPAFLKSMEAGGYNGPVAYEMCSPLRGGGSIENLDSYARTFLELMRNFVRNVS